MRKRLKGSAGICGGEFEDDEGESFKSETGIGVVEIENSEGGLTSEIGACVIELEDDEGEIQ